MFPFMEAIDVKFCTKCGAVTNSSEAACCVFCQAPLRKLAKISQHTKKPSSTNNGINYLAVLKTFNPVNRDSKYTEQVERGLCIAGNDVGAADTQEHSDGHSGGHSGGTSSSSSSNSESSGVGTNPWVPLRRSKRVDFSVSATNGTDSAWQINNGNKSINTQPPENLEPIKTNTTTSDKDNAASWNFVEPGYDDQYRPKVMTRTTSTLVLRSSGIGARTLVNRTMSSREMNHNNLNGELNECKGESLVTFEELRGINTRSNAHGDDDDDDDEKEDGDETPLPSSTISSMSGMSIVTSDDYNYDFDYSDDSGNGEHDDHNDDDDDHNDDDDDHDVFTLAQHLSTATSTYTSSPSSASTSIVISTAPTTPQSNCNPNATTTTTPTTLDNSNSTPANHQLINAEPILNWGSRVTDRSGNAGNTHANNTTSMASHRQDTSKLLARSDTTMRALLQTAPARLDAQFSANHRRSKLAKTGNFYIKHKPLASDINAEYLENIIANSPRVSPTENSRPKSFAYGLRELSSVTPPPPWVPSYLDLSEKESLAAPFRSSRSDPSLTDASQAYFELTGASAEAAHMNHALSDQTMPNHVETKEPSPPDLSQPRSADTLRRYPYLDPSAPRWCKVVNELFSTEFEYLRDLELLADARETLLSCPDLEDLRTFLPLIFTNLELLLENTTRVYSALTAPFQGSNSLESQESPDLCVNHICDTFIGMSGGFKSYTEYCVSYDKGNSLVKKLCETNPSFHLLLKRMEQQPQYRNTPFSGFLIKPVQRIFKYPLLFKELSKSLQHEPNLTSKLQRTIESVEAILTTINEAKRTEEQVKTLLRVRGELMRLGVADFEVSHSAQQRFFVKEGFIDAVDATSLRPPKTVKNSKEYRYFLFNDIFVCVRKSRKTSKMVIPLEESLVLDLSDNAFQLIHIRNKIWIFTANSPQEKKSLFRALESGIRKSASAKDHVSDTNPS